MYMFGDSFDFYATTADMVAGYWDSGATTNWSLVAGRYAGGRAISSGGYTTTLAINKTSGSNDAVHHFVLAFQQTAVLSGSTLGVHITLLDGATAQCSIVFRSDGAILLTNGAQNGTVLATYANATIFQSQWFAYEFEVVISNTAGSFAVRRANTTSNDFFLGGLNTRNSANNYANKILISSNSAGINSQLFDDFLWRSDPASVPWVGDVRSYIRSPATDASIQFSRMPSGSYTQLLGPTAATSGGGYSIYGNYVPQVEGNLTSIQFSMNTNYTGNVKVALMDTNAAGNPGNVLASGSIVTNPTAGLNVWNTSTFTPIAVKRGVQYFIATMPDGSATFNCQSGNGKYTNSTTQPSYAAFPVANPPIYGNSNGITIQAVITPTTNCSCVNETPQDGPTTYTYDSTVGHVDFYGFTPLTPAPPGSPTCLITRGLIQKSDAGSRSGGMQLKSGGATVQATGLIQTGWTWFSRLDATDPATGSTWTQAAIDAAQIGPIVTL
jgi:hypothetical protein